MITTKMKIHFSNDKEIFKVHSDRIPYLSFDMLDKLGVPNLFTTRYISYDGTTGEGKSGLRVSVMRNDDENEVAPHLIEMRSRLAEQLGSSIEMEYAADQKHTVFVNVVRKEDLGPVWPAKKPLHMCNVDGMVTDIPDVLLTVFGGDCPPVYIADPVRGCIGLVHAGRAGTLGRIPAVAIARMTVSFGCEPSDMYAAIGPGICGDCYEVGDEIYDEFADKWGKEDADLLLKRYPADTERGWKYHLDLMEANRMTLLRAGIPADHITVTNVCTKCNVDTFYSYRARRMENEQCAMIVNRFRRKESKMDLIVAADKNWGIGKDNGLLASLPTDMKYFKEHTTGKVVVMGRKTLESLPGKRGLPNRTNIVLTTNPEYEAEHCIVVNSEDELFEEISKYDPDDVMLIGGGAMYNKYYKLCNRLYVTKMDAEFDADTYITNYDEDPDFEIVSVSEPLTENGVTYRFIVYEKRGVK